MRFFARSKKTGEPPPLIVPTRLLTLRLTKLFENTKELLDLLDDGREKSGGEYILDFHYVSSLVERVIERMEMIVHDACILFPEGGEVLYERLAATAQPAREKFIQIDSKSIAAESRGEETSGEPVEPEYAILRQALKWMTGAGPGVDGSVTDLLYKILGHVFQERPLSGIPCEDLPFVDVDGSEVKNRVCVIDLDRAGSPEPAAAAGAVVDELSSRPFELMVLGAGEDARAEDAEVRPVKRWVAAMSSECLSMALTDPEPGLLLVVNQGGDPDTDFIFILCGNAIDAEKLVPAGFRTAGTEFGSMAWTYGAQAEELDEYLTRMGKSLFGAG